MNLHTPGSHRASLTKSLTNRVTYKATIGLWSNKSVDVVFTFQIRGYPCCIKAGTWQLVMKSIFCAEKKTVDFTTLVNHGLR